MGRFKILEHTADGLVEVEGNTVEELLKTGALAMFSLMVVLSEVENKVERDINASGSDVPELLMNFIKELIFLYSTKGELYSNFTVKVKEENSQLIAKATCYGEPVNKERHTTAGEVKMLTYHRFKVEQDESGHFKATLLFDM
jgi:SHS2 domain-containing protein